MYADTSHATGWWTYACTKVDGVTHPGHAGGSGSSSFGGRVTDGVHRHCAVCECVCVYVFEDNFYKRLYDLHKQSKIYIELYIGIFAQFIVERRLL